MNVPHILVGIGLTISLAGNGLIGWFALKDHQRTNRLVYDYAHDVGDINDTRLGGTGEWVYDLDQKGETIMLEPCPDQAEPGLPYWMRCYQHHFVRYTMADLAEKTDGRVNALESRLRYITEDAARFYGADATRWAVKDAIRDWNAEHNQDGDQYWNFGNFPDTCPNVTGSSFEHGNIGCPTEDDVRAANSVDADNDKVDDSLDAKAWSGTLPAVDKDTESNGTIEVAMPDGSKLSCTYQLNADGSDYADLSACVTK
ncbi:MAG: hypothetical protein AAB429_00195 [Patescibacteria group bacterium]|mgnify:CR=1 FL=1